VGIALPHWMQVAVVVVVVLLEALNMRLLVVVVVVLLKCRCSLKEVIGAPFSRKNSSLVDCRWSCCLLGLFVGLWRFGRCLLLLLCRGL
jgi:hypothetical protein